MNVVQFSLFLPFTTLIIVFINNQGCQWDAGDCCGSNINTDYYSECDYSVHIDDDYCNDGNNNGGCEWDGGDCCCSNGNVTNS